MELVLALVAIVVGLMFARRGYLHPGDYLVGAALAVLLALMLVPALPDGQQLRLLLSLGAPDNAVARTEFLRAHGLKIVLASLLLAVGFVVEAEVRRRVTPDAYA